MNQPSQKLDQKITAVIITKDRPHDLSRTLQKLLELPEEFPIIVVDNHSSAASRSIQSRFPAVTFINQNRNLGAIGRNVGVEAAKTPYIAFCDDDSWWDAGALPQAVDYFDRYPRVGAIAGKILVNKEQRLDYVSYLHSISPLHPTVPMPGPAILSFLGCGVFVRRQAYQQVGGYNAKIRFSAEEWLLGIDLIMAGWGITYIDTIIGHHYPSKVRQMDRRYQMGARNSIWATWLRRPVGSALKQTIVEIGKAFGDKNQAIGLVESILGLPYVLTHRQAVNPQLESEIQLLAAQERYLADMIKSPTRPLLPRLAGIPI